VLFVSCARLTPSFPLATWNLQLWTASAAALSKDFAKASNSNRDSCCSPDNHLTLMIETSLTWPADVMT